MATEPDPTPLLNRGLTVFPLPPGSKTAEPGWRNAYHTDASQWPAGHNIGVGCRVNSLVILDLDRKGGVDGILTLMALCADAGQEWPQTLTVRTPSTGLHLYYRSPDGHIIGSTSGGRSGLGPGIDTRGPGADTGGYVIGPGSIIDGKPYVIETDIDISPLPDWITEILVAAGPWWRTDNAEPER